MTHGAFLLALGLQPAAAAFVNDAVHLTEGGHVQFGYANLKGCGFECFCECLLVDGSTTRFTAMGLRRLAQGSDEMSFSSPVDVTFDCRSGEGVLYASSALRPEGSKGFELEAWVPVGEEGWKTLQTHRARFSKTGTDKPRTEMQAS